MTATATALQLRLPYVPPPGICRVEHCGNKLSVADTDGVCLQCQVCPLPDDGRSMASMCVKCRVVPRKPGGLFCPACQSAVNAKNYRARKIKYRRPLNLPCACCGKAPRHNGGSYCKRCGGDYQSERQQRRGKV